MERSGSFSLRLRVRGNPGLARCDRSSEQESRRPPRASGAWTLNPALSDTVPERRISLGDTSSSHVGNGAATFYQRGGPAVYRLSGRLERPTWARDGVTTARGMVGRCGLQVEETTEASDVQTFSVDSQTRGPRRLST